MFKDCFNKLKLPENDRESLRSAFEQEYMIRLAAGDSGGAALATAKDNLAKGMELWQAQNKLTRIKQAEKVFKMNRLVDTAMESKEFGNRAEALAHIMFQMDNLKAMPDGVVSVENQIQAAKGLLGETKRSIYDALAPEFFGLKENVEAGDMFIHAIAGDEIKPTEKITSEHISQIRKAADLFKKTIDSMLGQMRKEGIFVKNLDDWLYPQSWNQHLVSAAKGQFIEDLLPRLDRQKMTENMLREVKGEEPALIDGMMTDDQLKDFLRHAFMTIASDGATKKSAGSDMSEIMARLNMQRKIILKDTESRIFLHRKYSGKDMFSVVNNHLDGMARDIAIAKNLGNDPEAVIKSLMEKERAEAVASGDDKRLIAATNEVKKIKTMFGVMAGAPRDMRNPTIVAWMDTVKTMQMFKLAGSGITALFGDRATSRLTAAVNDISQLTLQRAELTFMNPMDSADRQRLVSSGIMFNHFADSMNRMGGEQTQMLGWAKNVAKAQMRLSLLSEITAKAKDAFRFAFAESIGRRAKNLTWAEASQGISGKILKAAGMDEKTWQMFGAAKLSEFDIGNIIDPAAINDIDEATIHSIHADEWAELQSTMKEIIADNPDMAADAQKRLDSFASEKRLDASLKLLGVLSHEDMMAIVEPTVKHRSALGAGLERGTLSGEMTNLVATFKTFPFSAMSHSIGRAHALGLVAGSGYATAMIGAGMFFGGLALQVGNLLAGKELEDQSKNDFWVRALAKGNGIGYPVDLLVKMIQDKTVRGDELFGMLAGPAITDAVGVLNLAAKGVKAAKGQGDPEKVAGSALKLTQAYIPMVNLPIVKLLFERSVMNQLQEALSPGYASKLKRDTEKNYGVKYYWNPAELTPEVAQ